MVKLSVVVLRQRDIVAFVVLQRVIDRRAFAGRCY